MRVNEIAKKVNVTADTVRYYTRIGLLSPRKSIENGYKSYSSEDEKHLLFILKSRKLGFAISEIQEIIGMSSTGKSPCCKVRDIVIKHLDETAEKILELQQLHDHMKRATDVWEKMPDSTPDGNSICDLIEMWDSVD